MSRIFFLILIVLSAPVTFGAERWQRLPSTPPPVEMTRHGHVQNQGASLYYAMTGNGSAVLLLNGSLGSSDDWGYQIGALAAHHTVIVMDSRGQGRSTRDARPFTYDLMADDVVALLDALKLDKVDVVGWNDGANIGLGLAMRHPGRVGKLFAFGTNTSVSGMSGDPEKSRFSCSSWHAWPPTTSSFRRHRRLSIA